MTQWQLRVICYSKHKLSTFELWGPEKAHCWSTEHEAKCFFCSPSTHSHESTENVAETKTYLFFNHSGPEIRKPKSNWWTVPCSRASPTPMLCRLRVFWLHSKAHAGSSHDHVVHVTRVGSFDRIYTRAQPEWSTKTEPTSVQPVDHKQRPSYNMVWWHPGIRLWFRKIFQNVSNAHTS